MSITRIWDADNGVWQLVGGTVGSEVSGQGLWLPVAGGTMSGPLLLATNPVAPEQAATKAYVDSVAGGGGGALPTGLISAFGGDTPPTGFLMCDGSLISRATYATLFSVIGTNYGVGDGSTTFGLPDLIRRFPLGAGTTADAARAGTSTLGQVGGNINHVHTGPSHTHTGPSHTHTGPSHTHDLGNSTSSGATTSTAAGSHGHGRAAFNTSSDSHSHSFSDTGSDSFGTGGASSAVGSLSIGGGSTTSAATTSHTHSGSVSVGVSGTTSSDSHAHSIPAFNTDVEAAHSHSNPAHVHDLGSSVAAGTGATGAGGTGATGAGGTGNTGAGNPPYQVVNYIIKT